MNDPIDRLHAADPGAGLGQQPDERAEADLRLLLAEPQHASAPVLHERRRPVPILVTAVVAIAVIALTAAVLGFVHPRTDVGGTPTIPPTLGISDCHPAEVLPFQCGTYRSTYGGKAITGDLGGPAEDRLSISFTPKGDELLLSAATENCFAETVLVRYDGKRLIRTGTPTYSENDCHGPGADRKSWAYAFLNGPLDLTGTDGPYFGKGASSVFFEYQGAASIGQPQLPRNDATCVPAHVVPFSCGAYFSAAGTGSVAFLGADLFRLSFQHLNGQLTAGLSGRCNALSVELQPDGGTVIAGGGASTLMGCGGDRGSQDAAVMTFFSGTLTYRIDGDRVTFVSGSSSATFSTDVGACRPAAATSPFCGSSTASGGSGSLAFLQQQYRIAFAQSAGRLTMRVHELCGTTTYDVTVGPAVLRLRRTAVTSHSCPLEANAHDAALATFLSEPMTWRWGGAKLTLDRAASGPSASAVFTREP